MRLTMRLLATLALAGAAVSVALPQPADNSLVLSTSEVTIPEVNTRDLELYYDRSASELMTRQRPGLQFGLFGSSLTALGGFASATCVAAITAGITPTSGVICGIAAILTLSYIIYGHAMGLAPDPQPTNSRLRVRIDGPGGSTWTPPTVHYELDGYTTATSAMARMYSQQNGTEPVLVAHDECEGSGCYEYFYANYLHPRIGLVHRVGQRPRGDWQADSDDGNVGKRQYTDQSAFEQNVTETGNNTPVFATYYYYDVDPSDEKAITTSYSSDEFAQAIYSAAQGDNGHGTGQVPFDQQGYYCLDIIDNTSGMSGNLDMTGYMDISEGQNMDDPDNEQSYLEQCYDQGKGI